MTRGHIRTTDPQQRREAPLEPSAQHDPAEVALVLQRAYGNHAVGRMLARGKKGETVGFDPGSGPGYRFGAGGVEQTALKDDHELEIAVESVIEDYFDGCRAMFMKNAEVTTSEDWAEVVFSHMEPFYTGDAKKGYDFGEAQVLAAVRRLKNKHRRETLLHMARTLVYEGGEPLPEEGDELMELKFALVSHGAHLDEDDDETLQAIVDTKGASAATAVEIDASELMLSDEENIVVVMDAHQNKHQMDLIADLGTYTGEPGNKFAQGKDLDWHIQNTVPVVRQTIKDAVSSGRVTPTQKLSPSKDAIDGINYDLTITYDAPTGKYVGTYHCNPVRQEGKQVYVAPQ